MRGGFICGLGEEGRGGLPGKKGRIAYLDRSWPEDYEIYSMKPDGTNRRQLTHNPADDRGPDISPGGTRRQDDSLREGGRRLGQGRRRL